MADLIINSGIQFISIPVNLNEDITNKLKSRFTDEDSEKGYSLKEVMYWSDEDRLIDVESINKEAYNTYGELDTEKINSSYVLDVDEESTYSISGKEALEVFEGHWVPLPYFRVRKDFEKPFHYGPENWCRINIQKEYNPELNTTHVIVLAFDTSANEDDTSEYNKPKLRDASDNGNERFKCVIRKQHAPKFFTSDVLWSWLYDIFNSNVERSNKNKNILRHVAAYSTLLELLENNDVFPEIGLLTGQKDEKPIEVGLTIDIGNSRTCGLLCEKTRPFEAQPFDFTSARKLQIRNLGKPHKVYDNPFEMQVAFSEERFGNSNADMIEGVFNWPSLVRIGPEAIELTSYFESEDSQASISSPKRYLWDNKQVKIPWIKVDSNYRLGYHKDMKVKEKALYGIASNITNNGRIIKDPLSEFGANDSRYSRSSIMMFSFYEILLHAVNQINSPEFRRDQGNSTYRRVLKDIVITCPTAMTVQEQYVLRKSAKDAIELLNKTMEGKIDFCGIQIDVLPALPSREIDEQDENPWKMDEAMCSQLAFLYGELIHKYAAKEKIFFNLHGKYRNEEKNKSLNVASIDIGGGTTDLMICNYKYDETSEAPVLTPTPVFWEGFTLAGDDIVKRIIEKIVIPTIHSDIENKGGKNVVGVINELFGENIGGQTAIEKIYRKQFANMIGAPIVHKIFNYLTKESENEYSFKLTDIFEEFEKPKSRLIPYINKKISNRTGVEDYDIQDITINIDKAAVNSGVKDVMGDVLKQLSFLVSHFDCDLLLLSGRPSRLPVISEIVNSTLNFGENIIVNLGSYRFGNWYPFANSTGYVDDPKSTVTVGALIAYLNNINRLPKLHFDFKNMNKIKSTAKYIGLIEFDRGLGRIEKDRLIFSPEINKSEFKFYGNQPISIGMRQLESEDWIATSLYSFDFGDVEKQKSTTKQHKLPYVLKFNKSNSKGEFIDKDDIEIYDSEGGIVDQFNFDFSLKTSNNTSLHWKDSGIFVTRIE